MVEIPDSLHCLFSATVEQHDGSYSIEIPAEEVAQDTITSGEVYRIAVFAHETAAAGSTDRRSPQRQETRTEPAQQEQGPPVDEGEVRDVSIDTLGDQGDGIAKVERGYVVIVPNTHPGDEVTVEIEEVRENVAFATIVGTDQRTV